MDLQSLAKELHNSAISERHKYDDVETQYCFYVAQKHQHGGHHPHGHHGHHKDKEHDGNKECSGSDSAATGVISSKIAAARETIHDALKGQTAVHVSSSGGDAAVGKRVDVLEKENKEMRHEIKELKHIVEKLQITVDDLRKVCKSADSTPAAKPAATAPKKQEADDEIDLFGSDEEEETEEQIRVREERLKAYAAKKVSKPGPIAKSSVILDVKPWDDETDMKEMERLVRTIEMDGLLWGASKFVPVGYGINKLQIMCVVEDDKVSVEELQEKIEANEDFVQSVDIAAFNKI